MYLLSQRNSQTRTCNSTRRLNIGSDVIRTTAPLKLSRHDRDARAYCLWQTTSVQGKPPAACTQTHRPAAGRLTSDGRFHTNERGGIPAGGRPGGVRTRLTDPASEPRALRPAVETRTTLTMLALAPTRRLGRTSSPSSGLSERPPLPTGLSRGTGFENRGRERGPGARCRARQRQDWRGYPPTRSGGRSPSASPRGAAQSAA